MPMNPNFLCCIGAELKNSTQQTTRMSQVYLYRSFEDETLSDMLSAGFFNAAMGIIRQDDLLLLYSPNETTAKYTYVRVSSVSSSGVVIEQIGIDATQIIVDTTGFSNITGNNLQEVLQSIDSEFDKYVKKDGSSVMTGPLKFRAGSFVGAIAGGLGDGIVIYKLKNDDTIDSEVASLTKENGFTPGTTNAQDIGSNSLKWKDLYVARVIASVLNNGANINIPTTGGTLGLNDFSNITDSAKNISNWSSNVSNCLTEIPQNINLELNNGILTLKAGSKVYVPNGAGVFDVYTVASDISRTFSVSNDKILICLDIDNLTMPANRIQNCTSGTTPPSGSGMFYDTNANTIRSYTSGTPSTNKISFPFAQLSFDSGGNCTIDQVFNGYGYIGSTVFALPGVKGLAPNDRNADKTLKSVVIAINSVITRTFTATGALYIGLQSNSFGGIAKSNYSYDPNTNIQYSSGTAFSNSIVFASCDMSSGVISNWTVLKNNPFHAVDYSDTEYMAHQATPSNRYVDLTLPASGSTITAPADGYLTINKSATAAGQYINFVNGSNGMNCNVIASSALPLRLFIPMSKDDVVTINYNAAGTTTMFRFVYANGAK